MQYSFLHRQKQPQAAKLVVRPISNQFRYKILLVLFVQQCQARSSSSFVFNSVRYLVSKSLLKQHPKFCDFSWELTLRSNYFWWNIHRKLKKHAWLSRNRKLISDQPDSIGTDEIFSEITFFDQFVRNWFLARSLLSNYYWGLVFFSKVESNVLSALLLIIRVAEAFFQLFMEHKLQQIQSSVRILFVYISTCVCGDVRR